MSVLLSSAAFIALLRRLGLQRQIKLFETFDAAIVDFERDTWRAAAGRPVVPAEDDDGGDLHGLLATSERRYISAGRSLAAARNRAAASERSEEHTSELQSLMRISYAVFCLKKKKKLNKQKSKTQNVSRTK